MYSGILFLTLFLGLMLNSSFATLTCQYYTTKTGYTYNCHISTSGDVKCWGYNGDGQLGQENTESLGDESGEMGDNLSTVDLGSGRTATFVGEGDVFTV